MSLKPYNITKANDDFKTYYDQTGYGSDIPVYVGARYQKGHGIGSLFSNIMTKMLPVVKRGALSLGKTALQTGLNIAKDGLEGKDMHSSIRNNLQSAGKDVLLKGINSITTGSGNKTRKRKAKVVKHHQQVKAKRPRKIKRDIFS